MVRIRATLGGFLALYIIMLITCGTAFAAGIRVVPSAARVVPGGDFYVDIIADNIPADGLGGVQFRLNVSAPGGSVTGVTDLSQAGPNDVAVASPLLVSPPTSTRSGIGDFFWNGRGKSGILVLDNEPLVSGSALYTFAHTNGAIPPSGSGTIARFMVRVGAGVNAERVNIGVSDVMLLDGGPAYPLDYATGASVQLRCMTTVPSLIGLRLGQAQAALASANLMAGSIYELDNQNGSHPLNVVLEQSTPAGGTIYCRTPVNLAINTPPAEVSQASATDKGGDDTGGVLLSWAPSVTGDVAGYRVYQGTTLLKDQRNPAATGTEIGGLPNGVTSQLRVTAYDTFGNESQGVTVPAIPIDDVPPTVTIAGVTEGAYYRTDVTPQVRVFDTNLAGQTITLNGTAYQLTSITSDGAYTLAVTGTDRSGNQTTRSVHFTVDKTPPTITVSNVSSGGAYNVDVTPMVTVTDANLKGSSMTLNGQPFTLGTPVTAEGSYALAITAEDLAGNIANQSISFIIDKTPPSSQANAALPKYTNIGVLYISGQTPLTISAQDTGIAPSGVAGIDYGLDGAQAWGSYTAPITLAGVADGSHSVTYRAYDRATNRENTHTLVVTVDNTPPATAISLSGPSYLLAGGAYATSATIFNLQATDLLSGVAKTEYRLDGGQWLPYAPFALSGEGAHVIDYRSTDNLGNTETVKSQPALIDNTPPVTAITVGTPQFTAPDGALYVQGSTPFSLAAIDNASGVQRTEYRIDAGDWVTYQRAFTVTAAGSHTVSYRSIDMVGNLEQAKSLTVIVDNTPPQTAITVGAPKYAGTNLFIKCTTPITLAATDDLSGVALTEYRIDDRGWTPYAPFTVQAEGTHVIRYRSTDHVGNREAEKTLTVILDDTPPVSTISIGNPKYQGSTATFVTPATIFTITSTDAGSGVDRIEYRIDGGAWLAYLPFTLSGEGPHTIDYRAIDFVGNLEAFKSLSVTVDTTPPVSAITTGIPHFTAADGALYGTSATTFTLTATDNLSGVARTEYRIDGGAWTIYAPFTIAAEGRHVIGFRSIDNVGNVETEKTFAITIDNTPPVTAIKTGMPQFTAQDGSLYVTSATSFTLAASDNLSGVARTEYRLDGGAWTPYAPFTIPTEGKHVIGYRSADNVGNLETEKTLAVTIDNTPPVSLATFGSSQYAANGNLYVSGSTGITLTATDNASGVRMSEYSIDSAPFVTYTASITLAAYPEGSHTIAYRSTDNLGNQEKAKQLTVILDKTPPKTAIAGSDPLVDGVVNTVSPVTSFTLTATDNIAGVKGIWYRIDGGQWQLFTTGFTLAGLIEGHHTISFSAVDNVGNEEPEQAITVRLITFEVKKSISLDPVVLVGPRGDGDGDGDGDDEHRKKVKVDPLLTMLDAIGITYHAARDEEDFELALRTGRFNVYLLRDDGKDQAEEEMREGIYYGDGLIHIKTRPDNNDDDLNSIFGVKFTGKSTNRDLPLTLPESPLGPADVLQTAGRTAVAKVTSVTAFIYGTVADRKGQYPAIVYNKYGRGGVLLFTFDLLNLPDKTKAAELLANSLNLVKPKEHYLRAQDSVPVRIDIANSTEPFGLEVDETIPVTTTADTITPAGTQAANIITWRHNLGASEKAKFGYYLNLPDAGGDYKVTTETKYANYGAYRLYDTHDMVLKVESCSADLLQGIISDLFTLPASDKKDRKRIAEAVSQLHQVRQTVCDSDGAEENIKKITEAAEEVAELSIDSKEVRIKLDELLKIWQRKWYLLKSVEKKDRKDD